MTTYNCIIDDEMLYKPHEERVEQWKYILSNLYVLIKNKNLILKTPEYRYSKVCDAFIGTTITGTTILYIGLLLELWEKSFTAQCSKCNGKVYIFNASGSPLSGRHQYQGMCKNCYEFVQGSKKSFGELLSPLFDLSKNYKNKTIIEKNVNHYFSPGGESADGIQQKIKREMIVGITIEELIWNLITSH